MAEPTDLDALQLESLKGVAQGLQALQRELRHDLEATSEMAVTVDRFESVQRTWRECAAWHAALIERIIDLRAVIESRIRTLTRLRARMHQIRGGSRPH